MTDAETVTLTFEADDGSDELEVPTAIVDALREADEPVAEVVADISVLGLAQQAHGIVHHSHGDVEPALASAEEDILDTFEERFGQTYAEMTGHDH
jgi:division protein CdvB (Snf7/Vps24/ESCRT-III family)